MVVAYASFVRVTTGKGIPTASLTLNTPTVTGCDADTCGPQGPRGESPRPARSRSDDAGLHSREGEHSAGGDTEEVLAALYDTLTDLDDAAAEQGASIEGGPAALLEARGAVQP